MRLNAIKTLARSGALAIGLAACGGAELVVPLFVFGFSGTSGGSTVGVFFDPDSPTTATGSFNNVNVNVNGNVVSYNGSWSGCSFMISVAAGGTPPAGAAASYSGQFQGMDTIVLTPGTSGGLGTLTLQRQGTATRSFSC